MHSNRSATWQRAFIIMVAGFLSTYAIAEESTPAPIPKAAAVSEKKEDIWNEFSFASEEDQKLTEKQIQEILDQLKKTDPPKAAQLEELRNKDTEKFIRAIRDEVKKHEKNTPEPPKQEPWKEELYKKHEAFLAWFQKQYPQDHKELIGLQVENPEKYVQRFMDLVKLYDPIRKTEKPCPQLADAMKKNLELQKRRDALLLQIRIASEEQQAKLVEELRSVISQRFDVILLEKQLQYDSIRKRLDDLANKVEVQAKELETLNKNKEQSVKDRIDELLERTEKVDWN